MEKYFPTDLKHAKELEFLQLKQGGMSIGEYAAKFEELAKFSMYYQHHPVERCKCVKFEDGLRYEIRRAVGSLEIRELPALVNKCRLIEGYDGNKDGKQRYTRL